MGINYFLIQSVFLSIVFQLLGYTSCRNTIAKAIKEQIACCPLFFL